jgi:DNA-binding transcriptional ArsR family regulator
MANQKKLDLILHPVRMRILQMVGLERLTTQQISTALPDVPTSSIYRHLKLLLDAGFIRVAETRQVRGIEEKVYAQAVSPRISDPADMANLTPEEHLRYFTSYVTTLIQGFADYLALHDAPDLIADRVGYSEASFYATPEEMDAMGAALNQVLLAVAQNPPGEGRQLRKLSIITHPLREPLVDDAE